MTPNEYVNVNRERESVCDRIRDHVRGPDVYVNVFCERERVCVGECEQMCERDHVRDPK